MLLVEEELKRELSNSELANRQFDQTVEHRRGIAEVELEDFAASVPDLERAVAADPKYDFYRAPALLAHAYANTGQPERAEILFQQATKISTMSETYYNYAL